MAEQSRPRYSKACIIYLSKARLIYIYKQSPYYIGGLGIASDEGQVLWNSEFREGSVSVISIPYYIGALGIASDEGQVLWNSEFREESVSVISVSSVTTCGRVMPTRSNAS